MYNISQYGTLQTMNSWGRFTRSLSARLSISPPTLSSLAYLGSLPYRCKVLTRRRLPSHWRLYQGGWFSQLPGLRHGSQSQQAYALKARPHAVCAFLLLFGPDSGAGSHVSLSRHDDVVTFFHEMGHVFHEILSKTRFGRFHGFRYVQCFAEISASLCRTLCFGRSLRSVLLISFLPVWREISLKRLLRCLKTGLSSVLYSCTSMDYSEFIPGVGIRP